MEVLSRIWKSCRGYGSPVESMEVLQRAWKSCREHGSPVESMEVLQAWKSCREKILQAEKDFGCAKILLFRKANSLF